MDRKIDLQGFKKVFWGIILAAASLHVNGFDILPDFIGFILIYFGLKSVSHETKAYEIARRLSLVLIFTSMVRFYIAPVEMWDGMMASVNLLGVLTGSPTLGYLYNLMHAAIELACFYNICSGTSQLYERAGNSQWAELCKKIRNVLAVGYFGNVVSFFAVLLFNEVLVMAATCLAFLWVVGIISLLVMVYKARKKLHGFDRCVQMDNPIMGMED